MPELVDAMKREIELRKDYLGTNQLSTVYFGGGTPSLLPRESLRSLMQEIKTHFEIVPGAEITLEANPDDLTESKLDELRDAGINRLSIGVQSFSDDDLRFMNRAHNAQQAIRVLKYAQLAGFKNNSIDLIYGVPTSDDRQWKENLQRAFDSGIEHLSCYALTVEPRTALEHLIREKKLPPVDEEKSSRQFMMLMELSAAAGFEHYEISNFARPGKYSVHNSSYWSGDTYLGIGPAAHSFDTISRQWNVSNNPVYIQSLREGIVPFEREILSVKDRFNEYVMTSLRTMWGMDLMKLKNEFSQVMPVDFFQSVQSKIDAGFFIRKNEKIILTDKGKLFADKLASELFI